MTLAESPHPRVAAIDIGSNAIRFLAVEFRSAKESRVIDQQRVQVRLGHDAFVDGRLKPATIDRAVDALSDFRAKLDALAIEQYRAVATSAVRDSQNGTELVTRARTMAAIDIEVIDGAEEARLVHAAVRSRVPMGSQQWLLVDLGGGSVEISVVDAQRVHQTESYAMGSVRLLEEFLSSGGQPAVFQRRIDDFATTLRHSRILATDAAGFIATGGNIEVLANLGQAPADDRGVARLHVGELRELVRRMTEMTVAERAGNLHLRSDRADVILPAALVYHRVATLANAQTILVPRVGVKEGITLDLVASRWPPKS